MKSISAGRTGQAALLVGACGLALAFSATAQARTQDAGPVEEAQPATDAPEPQADGNEIIVTATKREQTLQDVPVAVSVTSARTLEQAQIRDLKDLTSVVPSLRVTQLQSSAQTNFIIRGFGNGANNAGIEPSVGVFIDGVYRSRSAAQIGDFPDVQRIEVLRGPQSTLFGKNASVGVISIVTQAPKFDFGGNVEASYGNYDAVVLKGVVTGPITDQLAVSLAGGLNKRDGYNKDLGTGNRTNERDRWFLRGQALWEPNAQARVRLIGDYSKIDENCCGVVNLQPSSATLAVQALGGQVNGTDEIYANKVYSNIDSTNRIENWGASGQVDYDLGPLTFTSITAFRRSNSLTNQDSDFSSADLIGQNTADQRIRTFTQELRVATNMDGPLNFLVGGYYFNENIRQTGRIAWGADARSYADFIIRGLTSNTQSLSSLETTFSGLTGTNYTGQFFAEGQGLDERYRLKNEAYSFFGQADFKIGDRLTVTGGINYTNDKKRFAASADTSDVFSSLDLVDIGGTALSRGFISTALGTTDPLAIAAFASANPDVYATLQTQAAGFAALNARLSTSDAAADANPLTVGNPLLALQDLQFLPPFLAVPNAVEPGRTNDDKFTYVVRVAYDLTDNINVYASYATGFKASSINLSRDSRPFEADREQLTSRGLAVVNQTYGSRFAGPESSTVYEIGLKADWGLVTANVAAFDQRINGFQSNTFTGSGFVLANAGKQSVRGLEFEGTVKPAKGWLLNVGVTYLDPKYDSFVLSAVGDLSNTRPAGIPAISSTFGASYDHEFAGGDHLILRGDFHYESPVQIVEGLPGFLDAGTSIAVAAARPFRREVNEANASITWAMQMGLELTVWGRNLTNNRYLLSVFDTPAQPGSISGYTSQPRTYGVTGRFRF
ncbi:TonB-dependent receptor [Novosphingobium aromaticivorans DSM 12444]|uniref:TonB-dependent receptor n=1 Tax=Novosphingobium aromaticivorans (strain ATCC 700278 / DSM 12444 / CCUG 56034 / CIP 105152 / NBRC 16084 / F199) TaxID=279238 RepID=Q2G596_NOVAD|nr:TonB-dependent receptor [Novosphingobium aromaticivorans]ABD26977.1 TonB-dependent receptor [Novosphingobium aromaticivorans DSM 12444]SCY46996.1 TonB-dependent Receptor Plug Domain [Novosphingobium aromaticivorans]